VKPINLSDRELELLLDSQSSAVIIEFWSFRCETCRHNIASLSKLAETLGEKIKVYKVNVDDNPRTASRFSVPMVPWLLIIQPGGEESSFAGVWRMADVLEVVGGSRVN